MCVEEGHSTNEPMPFLMHSGMLLDGADCWCRIAQWLYEQWQPESPFEIEKKSELFDVIRAFRIDRLHALLDGMDVTWTLSERLARSWWSYNERVWAINHWRHEEGRDPEFISLVVSSGKYLASLTKATLMEHGLLDAIGTDTDCAPASPGSSSTWTQPQGEA